MSSSHMAETVGKIFFSGEEKMRETEWLYPEQQTAQPSIYRQGRKSQFYQMTDESS